MKHKTNTKPEEIDSMLYKKTNQDFNNEKPNPLDPLQIKANPIQEEKVIKSFRKKSKK